MAFIALIAVAGINTISTKNKGVLGATNEGDMPLAQFAVPDARTGAGGDANIAQDDCDAARIPCPSGSLRTPACQVERAGRDPGLRFLRQAPGAVVLVHARR